MSLANARIGPVSAVGNEPADEPMVCRPEAAFGALSPWFGRLGLTSGKPAVGRWPADGTEPPDEVHP
jgi:hypothetical protein